MQQDWNHEIIPFEVIIYTSIFMNASNSIDIRC